MSPYILQLLKGGYRLELVSPPPKNYNLSHPPRDRQRAEGLLDNIHDLADQEVIAPVPSNQLCQGFYSHVLIIQKPSGKFHLIINLRKLNKFI